MKTASPEEATGPLLERLDEYPHLREAIEFRHTELEDYLNQLKVEAAEGVPAGYDKATREYETADSISPHIAVPLLLKRLGAPIAVGIEDTVAVYIDPEIKPAYDELWRDIFHTDQRQLSNDMATGGISKYDFNPTMFHVVPIQNSHILWAHGQGILPRAFVTSALAQFDRIGDDLEQQNFDSIAPLLEKLLGEDKVMPFSLETVLGMGVAPVLADLAKNPELAGRLKLDPERLPSIDAGKIEYTDEDYMRDWESYFGPLLKED